MIIYVNGEEKELIIHNHKPNWDIDSAEDIIGEHDELRWNEEEERYEMDEDDFEWWEAYVDKLNRITELEDGLERWQEEKCHNHHFGYGDDMETTADLELEYLEWLQKGEPLSEIFYQQYVFGVFENGYERIDTTRDDDIFDIKYIKTVTFGELKNSEDEDERDRAEEINMYSGETKMEDGDEIRVYEGKVYPECTDPEDCTIYAPETWD